MKKNQLCLFLKLNYMYQLLKDIVIIKNAVPQKR